jgi:uncharacterized membrane protein
MRIHQLLRARSGEIAGAPAGGAVGADASPLPEAIERNIAAIVALRRQVEQRKTRQDRLADRITALSGSMRFLYLHAAWFGIWILVNCGEHPLWGFDPYPFGLLTMIVSLEAIFLSTFVLISQNKMGEVADARADLDLQIDLLSEYEITRTLRLVDAMARKMGISEALDPELGALERQTSASDVMDEMANRLKERERERE